LNDIQELISRLRRAPEYADKISHYRYLPPVPARLADFHDLLPSPLQAPLLSAGIAGLYAHQVEALARLRDGQNVGITTPTASGKTLIYNLAVSQSLLEDPQAHALYLFPLKALAQDQLKILQRFWSQVPGAGFDAAIYDGDTPASVRARLKRKPPRVLLTNPDMLHYGLLAYPEGWRQFFARLKYVVLDEAHTYRGIFGSHVALILRRLRRLCGPPGPTWVASSATMANAGEFLRHLTGLPHHIVEESGAPREGRHVFLFAPGGSPYTEAAGLLRECLEQRVKTILFTKSRKITELITLWVQETLPGQARRIAAYRSGYLPEERRDIEQRLFRDELAAVISTSALESGIDVGGLDACLLVGYPGTMISTWQRLGRVGRQQRDSLLMLVALPDALDHYFLRNPDAFFHTRFENCVLDPDNAELLRSHLVCAAAEEPLTPADWSVFGSEAEALLPRLVQAGSLQETAAGACWVSARKQPQRDMDIRTVGEQYVIKRESTGEVLGNIDEARVFKECHPGAIYLHAGTAYEILTLDLPNRTVIAHEADVDWYTQYTASEDIDILDLAPGAVLRVSREHWQAGLVRVRVTEKIVAYERHRIRDQSLLSEHKLTLPPRVFETQAALLTVPERWRRKCQEFSLDFAGGLHAAEHLLIAALPVQVLCERWDLGGLSTQAHPQVDQPCLFIYDGYPGGVGLAAKSLQVADSWLATARDMVNQCECQEGCPVCIHSPKCGSGNQPLDKQACQLLLNAAVLTPLRPLELAASAMGPPPAEPPPEPPRPASPAQAATPTGGAREFQLLVFDLETQRLAQEVGGWENTGAMGLSLGVVYDHLRGTFQTYREEQVQDLIRVLLAADWVVGFNLLGFDLKVLAAYHPLALRVRAFDLLLDIRQSLGYRLSLDHLAQHTLGRGKAADGLQAVQWFREGQWQELETYCRRDVEITRDLLFFGMQYGYVLFERRGQILKLPVAWQARLPGILPAAG